LADADKPNTPKKPKLDAASLKARLGLKQKKAVAPLAPKAVKAAAPAQAPVAAQAAAPTAESIAEARAASATAAVAAGPAIEDFSVVGQEATPIPAALPGGVPQVQYVSVGADATYPGKDKKAKLMMIGTAVGVGIVAFILGNMIGGGSAAGDRRDFIITEAQGIVDVLDQNKTRITRIEDLRDQLKKVNEEAKAVMAEDSGKDVLALEQSFGRLIPVLRKFYDDQVFIDPIAFLAPRLDNGKLIKPAVDLAVKSRELHRGVGAMLEEMSSYAPLSLPAGDPVKFLLVSELIREDPNNPDVKIPFAGTKEIFRRSAPKQVQLTSEGAVVGSDWQMVVVTTEDPDDTGEQVPTKRIMELDMKEILKGQGERVRRLLVTRLAANAERLHDLAKGIDVEGVKKLASEVANVDK
jgi:hypothetical protein